MDRGIEGWGLWVNSSTRALIGGRLVDVESVTGCVYDTCPHFCHDPAAPVRRWVPDPGDKLIFLGRKHLDSKTVEYYCLRRATGEEVYIRADHPDDYWARIKAIDEPDLPKWVRARLVRHTARR